MVSKKVLERFIQFGGYDVVEKAEDGNWRGIAEATRKTGISAASIRRLLKDHPEKPAKGQPKYVEEFTKSEGYKRFKQMYQHNSQFKTHVGYIRKGWLLLNKKDPISWGKDDYGVIWNSDEFIHPELRGVSEHTASAFHNLMRATDRHDLLAVFKGKKFTAGKKREWFLEDDDIPLLLGQLEENETLVMTALGIVSGGRFSSLVLMTPQDLNRTDLVATAREPKVSKIYTRFIPKPIMDLLQTYIRDYGVEPEAPLFTQSYSFYVTQMKKAGRKAKIPRTVSTHILKHTFVTQASRHRVSEGTIAEQTGTQLRTLFAHYRAKDTQRMRSEILGEQYEAVSFDKWIEGLMPYFRENYERIKKRGQVYDGMRSRL